MANTVNTVSVDFTSSELTDLFLLCSHAYFDRTYDLEALKNLENKLFSASDRLWAQRAQLKEQGKGE